MILLDTNVVSEAMTREPHPRVRAWLDPWTFLWRCWRAWSNAPPPPQLQALLTSVGQGRPLDLYPRC